MKDNLREEIAAVVKEQFDHYLADISFRIDQVYGLLDRVGQGRGSVYAEDLNIGRHILTGYTVTNNSPTAGKIAWTDCHIVYNGTDYVITNNNTDQKYVWWSPTTTPTAFQVTNTKPSLANGEVLVFVNSGGVYREMLSDTNSSMPRLVSDGAIDTGSIIANAVGTTAIADGAVGSSKLGANAVTSAKLADGAVSTSAKLAASVVASGNLADNAVTTAKINAGAVSDTKLADSAVTNAKLATNAVTDTKINANAVTAGKLADGAVNTSAKLAAGVVNTTQLATNAVNNDKLANGAVGAVNLNILRHVMY